MTRNTNNKRLTGLEINVLTRIDWRGRMTPNEVSNFFEIDLSESYKILGKLKKLGYLDITNERPAQYYSLKQNDA